jgi:hypothetical protein
MQRAAMRVRVGSREALPQDGAATQVRTSVSIRGEISIFSSFVLLIILS